MDFITGGAIGLSILLGSKGIYTLYKTKRGKDLFHLYVSSFRPRYRERLENGTLSREEFDNHYQSAIERLNSVKYLTKDLKKTRDEYVAKLLQKMTVPV